MDLTPKIERARMERTQIQFTAEQFRWLREASRAQGRPLARIVRDCVEAEMKREKPRPSALYERAVGLVGKFADTEGAEDLAREHDRYLDEAFS